MVTLSSKSGTIRPAIINARIFPRFQLVSDPSTSVVEETTELMVSDEGARHINIYKGVTGMVKAWGLKTLIPPSDLILHDACKAVSQNVFTTTEIAKFQNVQDAPYDILYVILIS
jgi:hypothetical protein